MLCSLSFALGLGVMFSINTPASGSGKPYGDNIFCFFSGVTDNSRTNTINNAFDVTIDGSGITSGGNSAMRQEHDFEVAASIAWLKEQR